MSNEIKALYPGSFDPPTNGHAFVIQKAARLFPHIEVQVGQNPDKKYIFSAEERMDLIEKIVAPIGNVAVSSLSEGFTIEYAHNNHFTHIIKGLRNGVDFEYERDIDDASQLYLEKLIEEAREKGNTINEEDTAIDLISFKSPPHLRTVSSSFVRSLIKVKGWEKIAPDLVPQAVMEALVTKVHSQS